MKYIIAIAILLASIYIIQRSRVYRYLETENHILRNLFLDYNGENGFHRWLEYADIYEKNINHIRNRAQSNIFGRKAKILEIGIQSGGSIPVWKEYFGKNSIYVGLDINPKCKQYEDISNQAFVEIGDCSQSEFLKQVCEKYGPFDFIVDDGAHTTETIMVSFYQLWNCMEDKGIYAIEDLHTMYYWNRSQPNMQFNNTDVYGNFADIARDMNKGMFNDAHRHQLSGHIKQMQYYDSVIILEYSKEPMPLMTELKRGYNWIPYN